MGLRILGVWGSGFRGLGIGVYCLRDSGFVRGLGFRGLGFRVPVLWLRS